MNPLVAVIILTSFAMSRVPKERRPKLWMIVITTVFATFLFFFLIAVFMGFFTR
jgi:small neutral amino acid transporter SnatA (MarC family)